MMNTEIDMMDYQRDAHVWRTVNFLSDQGSINWRKDINRWTDTQTNAGLAGTVDPNFAGM